MHTKVRSWELRYQPHCCLSRGRWATGFNNLLLSACRVYDKALCKLRISKIRWRRTVLGITLLTWGKFRPKTESKKTLMIVVNTFPWKRYNFQNWGDSKLTVTYITSCDKELKETHLATVILRAWPFRGNISSSSGVTWLGSLHPTPEGGAKK